MRCPSSVKSIYRRKKIIKKDKNFKGIEGLKREFYEGMRELKESQKKTDKQIKNLGIQIGNLTDGWGKFTEGLVVPSIPKLFKKFGVEIQKQYQRARSRRDGREMEIDILSIGRDKNNSEVIIAVEAKSNLESRYVDDFKKNLDKFFQFFKEYKGMELIGVVTGIRLEKDVEKYAQREGLFVLGPSGETMKILNSKGFKPKIWRK